MDKHVGTDQKEDSRAASSFAYRLCEINTQLAVVTLLGLVLLVPVRLIHVNHRVNEYHPSSRSDCR